MKNLGWYYQWKARIEQFAPDTTLRWIGPMTLRTYNQNKDRTDVRWKKMCARRAQLLNTSRVKY